jgi:prolipoprotein diacylglyceryltransferase/predicted O-methyltransferase YrrM
MAWLGFFCAYWVLRADLRRRRLPGDALNVILILVVAGLAGSKLYHLLERPQDFLANPLGMFFSGYGFAWFGGFLGGLIALLVLARHYKIPTLKFLDACAPAGAVGYAIGRIGCLLSGDGDYGIPTSLPWGMAFPNGLVPTPAGVHVHPTPIYEFLASMAIGWYLWRRGERSLRIPRPAGEVVAEYFILSGVARFLVEFIRINPRTIFGLSNAQAASLLSIVAGAVLLLVIKPRFKGEKQEHKVLRHIEEWGDVLQPEVHRPTPECPHPERWRMYDGMTAEYEVLQFLKSLVTTVKPRLVVETGTFSALSTIWIAEGLRENGFGKVITCESDPKVFEQARQRMEASGLMPWIECRNQSSLEMKVEGTIDIFFSDSGRDIREQEVRRFLPQISPNGLILMHDASSHLKTVRESALRMEAEGLVSVLLLPTPRGLVVAQKRAGRH